MHETKILKLSFALKAVKIIDISYLLENQN